MVIGPKGGVGRTTVAANLAIAAQQGAAGRRTILLDANLLLGDVAVQMGTPTSRSMLDLVPYAGKLDVAAVEHVLARHASGVELLLRPEASEEAELITPPLLREIVQIAAAISDVLVIDTEARYDDERTLVLLEMAATVIVVITPDISSVRNARHFLDLSPRLGFDSSRIQWAVNRANASSGVPLRDVANVLGVRLEDLHTLPDGGASVAARGNLGTPVTLADPRSELARSLTRLAANLVEVHAPTK